MTLPYQWSSRDAGGLLCSEQSLILDCIISTFITVSLQKAIDKLICFNKGNFTNHIIEMNLITNRGEPSVKKRTFKRPYLFSIMKESTFSSKDV